jgi:LuxR family transcriptional regulator, maltose regulon positive regulatory protein
MPRLCASRHVPESIMLEAIGVAPLLAQNAQRAARTSSRGRGTSPRLEGLEEIDRRDCLRWACNLHCGAPFSSAEQSRSARGIPAPTGRAGLYVDEGRIDQCAECLNRLESLAAEYPAPANCAWSDIHRYAELTRAYIASAEERFEEAASILSGLRLELENVQNLHLALRIEARLATVRLRAKQVAEASAIFRGIVTRFARADIYYTLLDEGVELGPLLAAHQKEMERAGSSPELISYVSKLMALWRSRYQSEPGQTPTSALAEPLSVRESDIVKLIAEGLSNKEIARTLAITPETVKSHVKHIFIKLNVEKRAQAVSRAQMLGLAGTRPS